LLCTQQYHRERCEKSLLRDEGISVCRKWGNNQIQFLVRLGIPC